jgi:phage-related minor tail protein
VEAADTPPFFHDNSIATLEQAVDFYNGTAFADSPSGRFLASASSGEANGIAIHLESEEVAAVAAFLRVLNALENVRSASKAVRSAARSRDAGGAVEVASADVADAAEVLGAANLHADAVRDLRAAETLLLRAVERPRARHLALGAALFRLESARRRLVVR